MTCPSCGRKNPDDNGFCGGCGKALIAICSHCGRSSPPDYAFCGHCAQRLEREPAADERAAPDSERGERRQLTVLFCDLVGSTELAARLDPEEYSEALHAYHSSADEVITRLGGHVAQHLGDGLLVYFGWPQTYDDAAERAVRAGLELVEATAKVQAGGAPLAARVGLHTGAVVVSEVGAGQRHETLAVGDTPNVAARVQAAAKSGQVMITAATHRLVAGLFIVEEQGARPLKGVPQPVELYSVVQPSGVRGRLKASALRGLTPFVNRTEERALLRSRFERVCDGEGQVVVLTGEAGIGKSRLAQVVREDLAATPHTWWESGGAAYFAGTPFFAISELLEFLIAPAAPSSPRERAEALTRVLSGAGLDPRQALPLVASLLRVSLPEGYQPLTAAPEIVHRRLLATLAQWIVGSARAQPLVILLEDLHWVDPSTLELQQILVEQVATAPILLLYTTRPEFPVPWPTRAHHTNLTLNRLPNRHVRELIGGVAARSALVANVVEAVLRRTDGVPLFVEELTKAVLEAGTTVMGEIPSTLADSLMARLDRLGPQAKEVAQVGAVCGREFSYALLRALTAIPDSELKAALHRLADAELVHVQGIAPDATYVFRHALMRDNSYASLLRSRRRALHAAVADALLRHTPHEAEELPELVAHHHTEGGQLELAAAAWLRAGERTISGGATREGEQHLRRGLQVVAAMPEGPARDQAEFPLQVALGQALCCTKGYSVPEAAAAFAEGMRAGERIAPPEQLAMLALGLALTTLHRDGPVSARLMAEQVLALAQRSRQAPVETLAYLVVGTANFNVCELSTALDQFTRALALYDDATAIVLPADARLLMHTHLAFTTWHLGFADQARGHMQRALERGERSTSGRAMAEQIAASFAALLREPADALLHAERALAACAEEPTPSHAALAKLLHGWALAHGDRPAAGRAAVQEGIESLHGLGQRLGLEMCHCLLADIYALDGDLDMALRVLAEGEAICPEQTIHRHETLWRRADLLARSGAPAAEMEAAFIEALGFARRCDARSFELRIATGYARWLREHGRVDESRDLLAPIYARFTEGFDSRDLCDARELLDSLTVEGAVATVRAGEVPA